MPTVLPDHKINKYFFLAIILILGAFLFYSLTQFFTAFLAAIMLYVLSKPFMTYLLRKKRWRRPWAAVAVIIVSFFIILLPVSAVAYLIYGKAKIFLADPLVLEHSLQKMERSVNEKFNIKVFTAQNIADIQLAVTHGVTQLLNQGLNFFATITMMYFFLYFMMINIYRMEAAIVFFLPFKRSKIELFGRELVSQTFSNSVGVPLIAVVQGLIGLIGYMITGLPEAGFWAVITCFASIVPIVGTGLIWAPACAWLFINGQNWQGGFMLIWGAAIMGSADNVVRFLLARRMTDTHPIVTVLGVIIGLKYFGLPGLIFGPLLISYFVILLKIYYLEYQNEVPLVRRKKSIPVRFNLPFLGAVPIKKKK